MLRYALSLVPGRDGAAARPVLLQQLAHRALVLGVWPWRVRQDGALASPLFHLDATSAWLAGTEFVRAVNRAVVSSTATEPLPGMFVTPVNLGAAGDDGLVLIALDKTAEHQAWFGRACLDAGTDATAAAELLTTTTADSLARTMAAIEFMAHDLGHATTLRRTVDGCANQLVAGMEAMNALGFLGGSLHDLTCPAHFIKQATERIRQALGLSWCAVQIAEPLSPTFPAGTHVAGATGVTSETLDAALRGLSARVATPTRTLVLLEGDELRAFASLSCGTLALQRIARGTRLAGVLAAACPAGTRLTGERSAVIAAAAGYIGAFVDNAQLYDEQQRLIAGSLRALTATIEAKDQNTHGHSARVAFLASRLAHFVGLDRAMVRRAYLCGLVHDIGKIGIRESVLAKPDKLSDDEFDHIKRHPVIGYDILRDLPALADLLPGVLHHHERWDGRGYPHGLAGGDIPLLARLIAVVDTFDAMSSARAYRPALARERVLGEIKRVLGTQLDPELGAALLDMDLDEVDQGFVQAA